MQQQRLIKNSSQLNMFRAPQAVTHSLVLLKISKIIARCCRPVAGNIVGALYHKL